MSVQKKALVDTKKIIVPPPQSDIVAHDRVTVVGHLHHEQYQENPISVPMRFSFLCTTKHQPYIKRLTIKDQWSPFDSGCWIPHEDIGLIYIENRTGMGMLVQPTKQQLDEMQNRVLLLHALGAKSSMRVRPGRGTFVELENFADWEWKAESGTVPINLYVLPR